MRLGYPDNVPGYVLPFYFRVSKNVVHSRLQLSHAFFLALVYRYLHTEITPGISRDGLRNVLLAVRAEACGGFCGSMKLWQKFLATLRKT